MTGVPERPTIYDVAARAGVSITTVSNALNKPQRVGAATLRRVLEVIDELGFTPKADAVSQARRGVGRIGVLAPFSSYASYRGRLVGVLRACEGLAVEVVVFDQPSVAASVSPLLSSLPTTGRLDGMLLMGVPLEDAMARRLVERGLATVLVDSVHRDFTTVNVDDEGGGALVGEFLAERGHREVAYVSEQQRSADYLSPGQLRIRGLVRALGADVRHVTTDNSLSGGRRAAAELIAASAVPDAILAHYDDLAAGLVAGFRAAGLRVPQDVAVVGYDDGTLADALDLTTVRQPFEESGRLAAGLLLERLADPAAAVQHVMLPGQLVVRSTA
ncbi:LacI family DNA-binding transcriptional regulator [Fodinicola feengrottensis]|uniref:LacI family DNA-binding transcriptional regulator n=1 Tax=Fodinicola feengrottensis TaxID=435914 RepID=A0ABN2IUG7_9ACTN